MDMLLILRIVGVITIISFAWLLLQKKNQTYLVYAPLAFIFVFEVLFTIYHPLIGAICLVSFAIMAIYFYGTKNYEKFISSIERVSLYLVLGIFCCSFMFEIVETIVGRLF